MSRIAERRATRKCSARKIETDGGAEFDEMRQRDRGSLAALDTRHL